MTTFQIFSVKRPFDKFCFRPNDFFGKMNFRSNGLRLNGDSVKCTFGQMAFGQTVFGQMVFRSNGRSVIISQNCVFSLFIIFATLFI
jgi:hypothetical protein